MKNIIIPKEFMGVPVSEETMREVLESTTPKSRQKRAVSSKNVSQQVPRPSTDIDDLAHYVLVPAKTHGKYSYQDILVPMKRLYLNNQVETLKFIGQRESDILGLGE